MPLNDVQAVLAAPDDVRRDELIAQHLSRMETALARTREVVGSLREILAADAAPIVGRAPAAAGRHRPRRQRRSRPRRHRAVVRGRPSVGSPALVPSTGCYATGPAGATYSDAFFHDDRGEVVAFVPIETGGDPAGDAQQ